MPRIELEPEGAPDILRRFEHVVNPRRNICWRHRVCVQEKEDIASRRAGSPIELVSAASARALHPYHLRMSLPDFRGDRGALVMGGHDDLVDACETGDRSQTAEKALRFAARWNDEGDPVPSIVHGWCHVPSLITNGR